MIYVCVCIAIFVLDNFVRFDTSGNFHLPNFQNFDFSMQIIYGLKENFAQIHFPSWQFLMYRAIRQWFMLNPAL